MSEATWNVIDYRTQQLIERARNEYQAALACNDGHPVKLRRLIYAIGELSKAEERAKTNHQRNVIESEDYRNTKTFVWRCGRIVWREIDDEFDTDALST